MAYKKEEMKKRKSFKAFNRINNFIEKKQGFIYFILFVGMLAIIPLSSEGLATLIETLEFEELTNIIKYIFTFIFVISYMKMIINHIKEVKNEKNIINKM